MKAAPLALGGLLLERRKRRFELAEDLMPMVGKVHIDEVDDDDLHRVAAITRHQIAQAIHKRALDRKRGACAFRLTTQFGQ